jgi:hypothetical protein
MTSVSSTTFFTNIQGGVVVIGIFDLLSPIFWSEAIAIAIFERISHKAKRGWRRAHWTSNSLKDKSFA